MLIGGPASHGKGEHDFPAGARVLGETLNKISSSQFAEYSVGWPTDEIVDSADLVVLYTDGRAEHVASRRLDTLRKRMLMGKGLAVLHFALEPPESDRATAVFLRQAVGGWFEPGWSVNPVWRLRAEPEASHPAARGVGLLDLEDEWYFHLRFRDGLAGIQPLLRALPPEELVKDDGPRSGNPTVRAELARGERQVVAWTSELPNGARGFGFTGGHFHRNWYDPAFRRLVVNGLVWAAGLEVPAGGVPVPEPSEPLYATLDEAIARGDAADVRRHLAANPEAARGAAGARLAPLHQAILRKQTAIALLLLEHGADVDAPDSSGRTPLHLAVERDDATVAQALLARKADPARRDRVGWTPLHHAAAKNRLAIARLLLDAGLDPNVRSERGGTPLHEAAASGGGELVRLLLERGTDPSIVSNTGVTALDIAREFKNEPAIAELERK